MALLEKDRFRHSQTDGKIFTVPRVLSGWGTLKWLSVLEWLRVLD